MEITGTGTGTGTGAGTGTGTGTGAGGVCGATRGCNGGDGTATMGGACPIHSTGSALSAESLVRAASILNIVGFKYSTPPITTACTLTASTTHHVVHCLPAEVLSALLAVAPCKRKSSTAASSATACGAGGSGLRSMRTGSAPWRQREKA